MDAISTFNAFSRRFRDIADFLVVGKQLQEHERDRIFLLGLPPALRATVLERLRVVKPTVLYPRDPYSISDITEATHHAIEATLVGTITGSSQAHVQTATVIPAIKSEFTMAMETLTTTLVAALSRTTRDLPPHIVPAPAQPRAAGPRTCIYCGDPSHPIRLCPLVTTDATAGLVRRNEEGSVVLPSGSFVPNAFTGNTLRDRVKAYHQAYPDARAPGTAQQLLFE
ncbi:uncharacterized protein BXZ73DRAFT_53561, partial [Epithele typhae]|uniref:uncharacterized protein n=1 Tax=Epithele typhae TaxID=378194 RepID=UPI0020086D42